MENINESITGSLGNSIEKDIVMREGYLDQPISVLMEQDVWVRTFMHECCRIFGAPCVSAECLSKTDRFLYTFALMGISTSMRRLSSAGKACTRKLSLRTPPGSFVEDTMKSTSRWLFQILQTRLQQ